MHKVDSNSVSRLYGGANILNPATIEVISSCFNSCAEHVCKDAPTDSTAVTEAQSRTSAPFHKNANTPGVAFSKSQPDI